MTRRIWTIRETIAANVETLAHPAIGWAAFFFLPKWDVFGQLFDDDFLPGFSVFELEGFLLVFIDDVMRFNFLFILVSFPFIIFILRI